MISITDKAIKAARKCGRRVFFSAPTQDAARYRRPISIMSVKANGKISLVARYSTAETAALVLDAYAAAGRKVVRS